MLPEIGHFALVLALVLALVQGTLPLVGAARRDASLMAVARPAALLQFIVLAFSFACLVAAFLGNDFTVTYVANNSNSLLPWYYRFSAVWGGHEGSLLLWVLLLSAWAAAVALTGRTLPDTVVARVLGVMGLVAAGFLSFTLFTSNPFERMLPFFPVDGGDLNPLLQDIGLIVHPPMLYMGYVGFSVSFAFAIAGLLEGRLDSAWARWMRPWTTMAWVFLTLGISLGSWWAYYELGWGGWWFWDPVENASLMPWIAGTALIHSLAVTEKRGVFRAWTVMLAILAFALSLLGTFLVRSGVLTSVHAFASDPARGAYILALLTLMVGAALGLFAWRAHALKAEGVYALVSRETLLLGNNLLLMVVLAVVFLGTLFPLFTEAFDLGRISVGPPYFNLLIAPLTVMLMAAMSFGSGARWKSQPAAMLLGEYGPAALLGAGLGVVLGAVTLSTEHLMAIVGLTAALAVVATHVLDLWRKVRSARAGLLAGITRLSRSYKGMWLAHMGVAVTVIGVAMVSSNEMSRNVRMLPGDTVTLGEFTYRLTKLESVSGSNYTATRAHVEVLHDGKVIGRKYPEKRNYPVRNNVMTEAGIMPGLLRDHYVSLGEPLGDGAWSLRVQQKPFMRWVWGGSILMALGGFWAILDRRYRLASRAARRVDGDAASGRA
ncbi:MAG: heme lyase CcmF/NrfE family subunit [Gammaproteobacteria bacterium]